MSQPVSYEDLMEWPEDDKAQISLVSALKRKGKLRAGLFESNKKLHLHLNFEYFDAINRGEKRLEFRLAEKWKIKLDKGQYVYIRLCRGYQKTSANTVIELPYLGYELQEITHKHFGPNPVEVCAILVDVKEKLNW
jgi:hypothetical protein